MGEQVSVRRARSDAARGHIASAVIQWFLLLLAESSFEVAQPCSAYTTREQAASLKHAHGEGIEQTHRVGVSCLGHGMGG